MAGTLCDSGLSLHAEPRSLQYCAGGPDWPFPQVQHVAEQRRTPQPGEHLLVLRGVASIHGNANSWLSVY
jgi:hypothetical protein